MNKNTDIRLTLDAWAKLVVEKWLVKIETMKIHDTNQLADSFVHQVHLDAKGDPEKVDFMFNFYGKFIVMGVGRGTRVDEVAEMNSYGMNRRKSRPWYSKTFASQVGVLSRILAEKYALKGTLTIIENIDDNALRHTPYTV